MIQVREDVRAAANREFGLAGWRSVSVTFILENGHDAVTLRVLNTEVAGDDAASAATGPPVAADAGAPA